VVFAPSVEIRKSILLQNPLLYTVLNGLVESAWRDMGF
jgi:hypothetical protein